MGKPRSLKIESLKMSHTASPLGSSTKENIKPPPPPRRSSERSKLPPSPQFTLLDSIDRHCSETYPKDTLLIRLSVRLREYLGSMVSEHDSVLRKMKIMREADTRQKLRIKELEAERHAVLKLGQYLGEAQKTEEVPALCARLGSHIKQLQHKTRTMRSEHERSATVSLSKITKLENEISHKIQEEKSLRSHQEETTSQLQSYEYEVKKLHQKLDHTSRTIDNQSSRIEELSQDERQARAKSSQLQSQVEVLQHSAESEREINHRINHEIELHVCNNRVLQKKHDALSTQVESERLKLDTTEKRLEEVLQQLCQSEESLEDMRSYSQHLEERIEVLQTTLDASRLEFDTKLAEKTTACNEIKLKLERIISQYNARQEEQAKLNLQQIEHLAKRTELKFKRMSEQKSVLQDEIIRLAHSRRNNATSPVEFSIRIHWDAACARFGQTQVERFLNSVSLALSEHWLYALVTINEVYSPILPYYESERLGRCSDCLVTFRFYSTRHNCMICGKLICGTCKHHEKLLKRNVTCKPCRDLVRMTRFSCHSLVKPTHECK